MKLISFRPLEHGRGILANIGFILWIIWGVRDLGTLRAIIGSYAWQLIVIAYITALAVMYGK